MGFFDKATAQANINKIMGNGKTFRKIVGNITSLRKAAPDLLNEAKNVLSNQSISSLANNASKAVDALKDVRNGNYSDAWDSGKKLLGLKKGGHVKGGSLRIRKERYEDEDQY